MAEIVKRIEPQDGFQKMFLSSSADIVIGGAAAGVGKTFSLLMEPLRHTHNPKFGGVIFRRTTPQIRSEGGLWDTSMELYPIVGAVPSETTLSWMFPTGAKLKFSHLEYDKNVLDWQGSQIAFIAFDELTHFSSKMFFYLLSRNRSTSGVRPYVRATCNPDPDSWVADFISWWVDQDTGYPIKERAGRIRYFMKDGESIIWGNTKKEVIGKCKHLIDPIIKASVDLNTDDLVKSVTFIPGDIYDNKELLRKDPGYLANLMAQDEATKAQLLEGNWKVRVDGDELINYIKMKDVFTNDFVPTGNRYITADIALKGSDLLVIGCWEGYRLIDIDIMEKSNGSQVIIHLKTMATKWRVPQSRILYDDDGVGQFVDGFITGARAFKNGAPALRGENYQYLRDQCSFKMADRINNDGLYIIDSIGSKIVKGKSIKDHLLDERRAIKNAKPDMDGKLRVIPKEQRKAIIGRSTDIWDMIMMREWFEYMDTKTNFNSISNGLR